MALRKVVLEGDPILKKVCRPVTKFDDKLAQLLDDMKETMVEENGLGLAAPQVGILRRAFVALDESKLPKDPTVEELDAFEPEFLEFVNPEFVEQEGNEKRYEGCLSFPGQYGAVERPTRVVVKAFDRNGEEFTMEAEGLLARCICHESNHLDGITIDDLAEYFYDAENPHDLDAEFMDGEGEEDAPESPAEGD